MRGFTFIEILLVLGIFAILLASSFVVLGGLRGDSDLQEEARGLQRVLEFARNRTIASEGDARYGVYATSTSPHRYILFQGDDYASRDPSFDEVHELRDTVEFVDPANFAGLSGQEVVFDRVQGATSNAGNVVLRERADPSVVRTVYVEQSGTVEIDTTAPVSDSDRVKESRHVHIDYTGRTIDTATEDILLDFKNDGSVDATIDIASNLSGGQIVWEDTITIDGEPQTLKIHTHELNNGFDSQFSVHRDRRFNTKAVTIDLSGDIGTLIEYDAAGNITQGTSANVVTPPDPQ